MKDRLKSLTEKFGKNDWRQLTIREKKTDAARDQKYSPVIDLIKECFPDVPFNEASYLVRNQIERMGCQNCGTFNVFVTDPKPGYKTYCSSKCRVAHVDSGESIIVNGVIYKNFTSAMDQLGESRYEIRQKIFNGNFPNYMWNCDDHDLKCQSKLEEANPILLDKAMFIEWKDSKKSINELSEKIGISKDHIRIALIYHGIDTTFDQIEENAKALKDDPKKLEELYDQYSSEEIAKMYDVSSSAILQWLEKHQIQRDKTQYQSAIERHMLEFIKSLDPDLEVLTNSRDSIGDRIELDLFIPSKNLAIEFDGLYWHSEYPTKSDKSRHSKKQIACESKGITLLRFVDVDETADSKKLEIVKSIIKSKIGKSSRIHARKCSIISVNSTRGKSFFEDNHISGNRGASVYIGLEYEGELVMCMSFGRPLMNRNYEWEIIRMASKIGITVVGGSSKIFNHFLKHHTGSVMSYANLRFGNGQVYEKLGMMKIGKTEPGYAYTDLRKIHSRYKFRKDRIHLMCPNYDPSMTEFENAEKAGYRIYWDCGHSIFAFDR